MLSSFEASASTAAAGIPYKATPPLESSTLSNAWLIVVLCLAIAAAVALALRKRSLVGGSSFRGARAVCVVESVRLGERTRLSIVRYRGRELLVAHGDHAPSVIAEQPATTTAESVP